MNKPANNSGTSFEHHMNRLRTDFEVGEKVRGMVVAIDRSAIFVDIGARSEGIVDRAEFEDADGNLTVEEGQEVEAYYLGTENGEVRLATRFSADSGDAGLYDAFEAGIPVEGRVESERTGGYEVKVGNETGFCPYSQIDMYRQEPTVYLGQKLLFKIIEYDEHGRNLVLSRRELLAEEKERQKQELQERLQVGDVVDGEVTKLMPFGAFVNLGGVEGLIPISELAWSRTDNPEDVVRSGEAVKVLVKDIDWERERISLSLRQAQGDPWMNITQRLIVGQQCQGRVTKLMPFGAFVELEPGVEGLVHISKLGAKRRVNHPKEVVNEGDVVGVTVERIDTEQRRISLTMEDQADAAARAEEVADIKEHLKDSGGDLGSLGDLFSGLDV
jgi:small subunit ribosomal protein S1